MGTRTIHGKDIVLNRTRLEGILFKNDMTSKELWEITNEKFKLNITYKGFMSLLKNNSSWKAIYTRAICEVLDIENEKYLFEVVDVDVKKEEQRRLEWKEKYEKK